MLLISVTAGHSGFHAEYEKNFVLCYEKTRMASGWLKAARCIRLMSHSSLHLAWVNVQCPILGHS